MRLLDPVKESVGSLPGSPLSASVRAKRAVPAASPLDFVQERVHRLAISGEKFGPFSFVPQTESRPSLTYQAVLENGEPTLIQVIHQQGFHDRWLSVAALPLSMGYLNQTGLVYVSQAHPWGRITFINPDSTDLRHVTGFVLEAQ